MQRKLILLLIFVLMVGGGLLLVARKKAQNADAPQVLQRPTMVSTAVSRRGDLTRSRTYLGVVEPWQRAEVSSRITATVRAVPVREGQAVSVNQLLVSLDDEEINRGLQGALARADNARQQVAVLEAQVATLEGSAAYRLKEFRRDRMLAEEGAIAQAQADASADLLNRVRGDLAAARRSLEAGRSLASAQQAQAEEARLRLGYARIDSPFAGLVAGRRADPGDLAAPGQVLLTLEDHSRLKVVFHMPQQDLASFDQNRRLRVHADDWQLVLPVARRHPSLNPDRTLTLEVDLPADSGLQAGAYCRLSVPLEQVADVVLVPADSLVPAPQQGTVVFVIDEGVTRAQPVEVLLVAEGLAAVRGLAEGVAVVRSTYLGWNRLAAGEAVEVKP